jgi:hypothetical protein
MIGGLAFAASNLWLAISIKETLNKAEFEKMSSSLPARKILPRFSGLQSGRGRGLYSRSEFDATFEGSRCAVLRLLGWFGVLRMLVRRSTDASWP